MRAVRQTVDQMTLTRWFYCQYTLFVSCWYYHLLKLASNLWPLSVETTKSTICLERSRTRWGLPFWGQKKSLLSLCSVFLINVECGVLFCVTCIALYVGFKRLFYKLKLIRDVLINLINYWLSCQIKFLIEESNSRLSWFITRLGAVNPVNFDVQRNHTAWKGRKTLRLSAFLFGKTSFEGVLNHLKDFTCLGLRINRHRNII